MSDQNSLIAIAANARQFLETIWPDWQLEKSQRLGSLLPSIMSFSTCASSSTFVQKVLYDFGVEAQVRHGWYLGETPKLNPDSAPRHTWVVSGKWFIDVTADQFGADKVIITDQSDSRYLSDIDVALPEFRRLRVQSVFEIWGRWMDSPLREQLVYLNTR
jgi:hypothetical protein